MAEELAHVLSNTQSGDAATRQQAEAALKQARANPAFPLTLVAVASHVSVDTAIRQSALSVLRRFVEKNWNPEGALEEDEDEIDTEADNEPPVDIPEENKAHIKQVLLELVLSTEDNRKVKSGASQVVSRIAAFDVPDKWPELLPTLLNIIPSGQDTQVHGALKILSDIVDESLSEDQFFTLARDIIKGLAAVALNTNRSPMRRALAVHVFRGCFELLEMVKEEHPKEVKAFGDEIISSWEPFFLEVLKAPFPQEPISVEGQPSSWNGPVALKLQVIKTLIKIKNVLPSLIVPNSTTYFSLAWSELQNLRDAYKVLYMDNEAQGRLEDVDQLPYTLDLLVLEQLDLVHQYLRAPPVEKHLQEQLAANINTPETTPWMADVIGILIAYSCVTQEQIGLWDIDASLFLSEEALVTANYTPRTACGDMMIKLGEMFKEHILKGLLAHTKPLFVGNNDWRIQEAALSLFNSVSIDFQETSTKVPEDTCQAYLELVNYAIAQTDSDLLRARGYLVGATLTAVYNTPDELVSRTFECINGDKSEVVRVSCIKAVEEICRADRVTPEQQVAVIAAIGQYMASKNTEEIEESDELVVALAESLRNLIIVNPAVALSNQVNPCEMLFNLIRVGASSFQVIYVVTEAFEEIVGHLSDTDAYGALSAKILPTLTAAFDSPDLSDDDSLISAAADLLVILIKYGSEPLPAGFVAATLPKLKRVLMEAEEGDILRPACECVMYLLSHDHQQVLNWTDGSVSGLDVCLHIIDRMLSQDIEDNAASEVGGLAAELVEKAGHERLGPYLLQLLTAVANRLATAEAAPFIQSLILVFARLSLNGASDVVEFLSQIRIGEHSGLEVVMSKWLEHSVNFAGYDEIRQNVIALSKLYALNDPRLAQTMVKGDLIIQSDGRIMTRSRAKKSMSHRNLETMNATDENGTDPDQYTVIPVTLKIVKVLVEELLTEQTMQATAALGSSGPINASVEFEDDDGDDVWEDEDDALDQALGSSKSDLLKFLRNSVRERDDETQDYLVQFFIGAAQNNLAGFSEWYKLLTEEEKAKLAEVEKAAAAGPAASA
ncbi:hypothetical protein TD95_003385 [Thielaviopsis punctulata]|uniref:Importin N-terminal domain-containing protein n=1 Tax=Thielaviopsis punctulata TaxID=72032 RepID=A0A0F4ZIG3_9PEZI|nr:hypothetical protein TD95_003385 [Thielaviopsis punctulata]